MSTQSTGEEQPLWNFVDLSEYTVLSAPIGYTSVKDQFTDTLQKFWSPWSSDSPVLEEKDGLRNLPRERIDALLPVLDWQDAATALRATLSTWLETDDPNSPVLFVVGPPNSGISEILKAFATQVSWQMVAPPAPDQMLTDETDAVTTLVREEQPYVFPALEDWF